MNKIASVVYPYSPKNEDELELQVGDKIEVIGIEEEGWWKGSLKGRLGVFPSNFVKVVEAESPTSTSQNTGKLNSIFGSRVGSKNSLSSSNSLNNISSSNNNLNIHNNNSTNSNNSNNLIMNNTHPQQPTPQDIESTNEYPFATSADGSSHPSNPQSERRPKPLRGIGFGDIFAQGAKTKPLPADPMTRSSTTALASERFGANNATSGLDSSTLGRLSSNTLQKPIPKKPPPPAPADNTTGTNGSSSEQAPALPPKPSNQFSPFLQQRPLPNPTAAQHTIREQARVIYAYKPSNDDELEMQVDDIINIIDKDIEDAGWWKGELNGKIGVFPDNFVQLIGVQDAPVAAQESHNSSRLSGSSNSTSISNASGLPAHHQQQASAASSDGKREIKSVFAGTPKGFSKELESNLEKHSNPASFLSLKRNKLHQQQLSSGGAGDQPASIITGNSVEALGCSPGTTPSLVPSDATHRQNGHPSSLQEPTSPGKLNHITANRAKGPTRRPPSNILNKRNQLNELNSHNHDSSNDTKNELPQASLPPLKHTASVPTQSSHGSLPMIPNEHKQNTISPNVPSAPQSGSFTPPSTKDSAQAPTFRTQAAVGNGLTDNTPSITPKSSQRASQPPLGHPPDIKSKMNPTSAPSTPPWMVELRKTNAEKKRDPLPATASTLIDDITTTSNPLPRVPTLAAPEPITPTTIPIAIPTSIQSTSPAMTSAPSPAPVATTIAPVAKLNAPISAKQTSDENIASRSDEALRNFSNKLTDEMSELREDVKKLQEDFKNILGLKDVIDTIKVELKTCQSATESQRKYIKELVNNLADERKRIAAMQTEIDRNLN